MLRICLSNWLVINNLKFGLLAVWEVLAASSGAMAFRRDLISICKQLKAKCSASTHMLIYAYSIYNTG